MERIQTEIAGTCMLYCAEGDTVGICKGITEQIQTEIAGTCMSYCAEEDTVGICKGVMEHIQTKTAGTHMSCCAGGDTLIFGLMHKRSPFSQVDSPESPCMNIPMPIKVLHKHFDTGLQPQLTLLEGDFALEVFTHKSIRREGLADHLLYGDKQQLFFMG
ncbi:hypothetical protein PILCRDRAFT_93553 [Piloderma croceum F 1598]|uniref:Uncharacterized protein n=1 Tax=Piloderma croceum (strain F 1598) TaxID=765440 RepID=A0A0C3EHV0_PILCF|nr:hypothetical protein PILCRDRAFT_93553 [Piloderma croceum F 1598]